MKKNYSLITLFLLSFLTGFGQENGVQLLSFQPSECSDEYRVYRLNNRIVSIEKTDSSMVFLIAVQENCGISLVGDVKLDGDTVVFLYDKWEPKFYVNDVGDTLEIIREDFDCECCFSFEYNIAGLETKEYFYKAKNNFIEYSEHKYMISKDSPDYDILDGDTINYVDIYGFPHGLHIKRDSLEREVRSLNYTDGTWENGVGLFYRRYYDNGNVEFELYRIKKDLWRTKNYYDTGELKSECKQKYALDDDSDVCIEFEKNGAQIIKTLQH